MFNFLLISSIWELVTQCFCFHAISYFRVKLIRIFGLRQRHLHVIRYMYLNLTPAAVYTGTKNHPSTINMKIACNKKKTYFVIYVKRMCIVLERRTGAREYGTGSGGRDVWISAKGEGRPEHDRDFFPFPFCSIKWSKNWMKVVWWKWKLYGERQWEPLLPRSLYTPHLWPFGKGDYGTPFTSRGLLLSISPCKNQAVDETWYKTSSFW